MELIKKLERKIPQDKLYLVRLGLWTIFHSIIYYLISQLLISFNISNLWLTLIVFGVLTTISSTIILKLGYNRRVDIDEEFAYYGVVHVVAIFMMNAIIIPTIAVPGILLKVLFTGFGVAFLARIAKRKVMRKIIMLTLVAILLITLPLPQEILSWIPLILIGLTILIVGLLVWPSIGGGHHHGHHHSFSLPAIPWWLIIIIIIVIAIFIKFPYAERPITAGDVYCVDGQVMKQQYPTGGMLGMFGSFMNSMPSGGEMQASLSCLDYKSSVCNLGCKGSKPICSCTANIWDLVLHTPGDWMFD